MKRQFAAPRAFQRREGEGAVEVVGLRLFVTRTALP